MGQSKSWRFSSFTTPSPAHSFPSPDWSFFCLCLQGIAALGSSDPKESLSSYLGLCSQESNHNAQNHTKLPCNEDAVSGNLGSHTSLTPREGKVKCQKDPPKFQQVHSHFSFLQALSAPFCPTKEPFNLIFHKSGAITGDFSVAPDCKYVSCHSLGHHTVWCILLPNTQASILMPQKMSMTHNFFVLWENVSQKITGKTKKKKFWSELLRPFIFPLPLSLLHLRRHSLSSPILIHHLSPLSAPLVPYPNLHLLFRC